MRTYFVGRYGAIKDIDFSPIFEAAQQSEVNIENYAQSKEDDNIHESGDELT
jgi:hypothetical protein